MLTPMEIHDHQFKKAFRGYNENEVDDFLDKVVVDFEKLLRENERLKNQLKAGENDLEHYRKLEKTMNDTLLVAQRTADEVISSARRNAEDMKEQTARECQQIRDQAQFEAKQQLDAANAQRDAILAEYAKLVSEKHSFLLKLRTTIESELGLVVQMLSAVPKVEEAATRPLPEVKPVETAAPVEEPAPVETVKPVKPEVPAQIDDTGELNIVGISSKPETVTDATKAYTPVKPASKLDKGAAK